MLITKAFLLAFLAATVQSRALPAPAPAPGSIFQPKPPGWKRPDETEPINNTNRPDGEPENTNFGQPDPNNPQRVPATRPEDENQQQTNQNLNHHEDESAPIFKPEEDGPSIALCTRSGGCHDGSATPYVEPTQEVIDKITTDLRSYLNPVDNSETAAAMNEPLYKIIRDYIVKPLEENKALFYIDGARTVAGQVAEMRQKVNVGEFYGGYSERVFNINLEPSKQILALQNSGTAPLLQHRWFQATSAVYAMSAKGDVFLLYPAKDNSVPWNQAQGSNGLLSIFNTDEFPLLQRNPEVGNIYLVDSRFAEAWNASPDTMQPRPMGAGESWMNLDPPSLENGLPADFQLPVQRIGSGLRPQ